MRERQQKKRSITARRPVQIIHHTPPHPGMTRPCALQTNEWTSVALRQRWVLFASSRVTDRSNEMKQPSATNQTESRFSHAETSKSSHDFPTATISSPSTTARSLSQSSFDDVIYSYYDVTKNRGRLASLHNHDQQSWTNCTVFANQLIFIPSTPTKKRPQRSSVSAFRISHFCFCRHRRHFLFRAVLLLLSSFVVVVVVVCCCYRRYCTSATRSRSSCSTSSSGSNSTE